MFVGEIRMFAGDFAPAGWMFCDGQTLPIDQYDTLFQVLGTTYGGDGVTTFQLPDLRGRVAIHHGTNAGGTYVLAEAAGNESVLVGTMQMPIHGHAARASSGLGSSDSPAGRVPARNAAGSPQYAASADSNLAAGAVLAAGGTQAHNNLQPYLGLPFIIAVEGDFPS